MLKMKNEIEWKMMGEKIVKAKEKNLGKEK